MGTSHVRTIVATAVVTAALTVPTAVYASHRFSDVPTNHPHHDSISWLAEQGVTTGCEGDRFCPEDPVTRAQMATFMRRLATDPTVNAATLDGATVADIVQRVTTDIESRITLETRTRTAPASDTGGYVQCSSQDINEGFIPIAGGFRADSHDYYARMAYPADALGWQIMLTDASDGFNPSGTAYVVCARAALSDSQG